MKNYMKKNPGTNIKGRKLYRGPHYPAGVLGLYILLREDKAGVLT
jgi:hypothetical protein